MDAYSVATNAIRPPRVPDSRCDACRARGGNVWCPDCLPQAELGDPVMLTNAERRYCATPPDEPSKPPPSLTTQLHRAAGRYRDAAERVADELLYASVANPPPSRATLGHRTGSEPSDPALAKILATHDAINRGMARYGHLLDDCLLCGPEADRPHNDDNSDTLAKLLDDDWSELADHLTGLSTTSPKAVHTAVNAARDKHTGASERFEDWWKQLRRDGAEVDVLSNLVNRMHQLANRMYGLAESMRQWDATDYLRRCACGCGGYAPPGRRVTVACQKREERAAS